jgi:hypothetical protein
MEQHEEDTKVKRDFKVRVLDSGVNGRRQLTLSELQGLNVLTTPAWVFQQKRREVPWANTEAMKAYFRRTSMDYTTESSKSKKESDTVRFYAMVEEEGCTVHIVGPRRVLLSGIRPNPETRVRRSPSNLIDNDIVTLVISPIEIISDDMTMTRAALFHEITLGDLKFDYRLDINGDDTPIDVISKMLDEIISGFPVPPVHAKFVRNLIRDGADMNQPVIFAKSFVMSAEGIQIKKLRWFYMCPNYIDIYVGCWGRR